MDIKGVLKHQQSHGVADIRVVPLLEASYNRQFGHRWNVRRFHDKK
jgi:hypothetical protein